MLNISETSRKIQENVSQLTHRETNVRRAAAEALWNLAVNAENKITIAQAGAISPLVRLLSDSDTVVRKNAVAALWNLAVNAENKITIAQAGAISPLVRLLSDSDTVVRQNAAGALKNLAYNNAENQITIAEAGAISPLVSLLSDSDTVVRQNAAEALWNLAFNTEISLLIEQEKEAQRRAAAQPMKLQSSQVAREGASDKKQASGIDQFLPNPPLNNASAAAYPPAPPNNGTRRGDSVASDGDTLGVGGLSLSQGVNTIAFSELALGTELGRGGFGVVSAALWQGATQVAVKQLIGRLTPDLLDEFQRETAVHSRLRHPNILMLYGVCMESMRIAIAVSQGKAQPMANSPR